MRRASTASFSASNLAPSAASPIRPPALMRGPIRKPKMRRLRRAVGAGHIEQRGKAGPPARAHQSEALDDKGAVEAGQLRHIGDRRQRDEIEPGQEIGLRPRFVPKSVLAQQPVHSDERHEDDARGAELAEAGEIILPVRIDDERIGQMFRRLMMIEHDRIEAEAPRLSERLMAHRAAIDGDEKFRACLGERRDRLHIRAVAFENAVGNMDEERRAGAAEKIGEKRRRTGAVDIIIAEDGDRLAVLDRARQAARPPASYRRAHRDPASAGAGSGRDAAPPPPAGRRGRRARAPEDRNGHVAASSLSRGLGPPDRGDRARAGRAPSARRRGKSGFLSEAESGPRRSLAGRMRKIRKEKTPDQQISARRFLIAAESSPSRREA